MKIWLIQPNEPIVFEGSTDRKWRTQLLGDVLAGRGHEVLRFASAFDHSTRTHMYEPGSMREIAPGHTILFLPSVAYHKSVSFRRYLNHVLLAREFKHQSEQLPCPDIVISSFPQIELAKEATDYATSIGIPGIVDVRDLWPDTLIDLVPKRWQSAAKLCLWPMYRQATHAFVAASAVTGVTDEYVGWALGRAGREPGTLDRSFPLAYPDDRPNGRELRDADHYWDSMGVTGERGQFVVACVGAFMRSVRDEMDVIFQAASQMRGDTDFIFVVCGHGDTFVHFSSVAEKAENVRLPGWIDKTRIFSLLQRSNVGLLAYPSSRNYRLNIPNKVGEYLSAGLPIVSSLQGRVEALLQEHKCGFSYDNGSPKSLATLLERLKTEPALLAECSTNARALFNRDFSATAVYSEMADHVEQVAGDRRRVGQS